MQFHNNAPVTAASGKDVGRLDRVVIDPKTKEVTHVIVHKGVFLTQNKVVPVEWIASADEDGVALKQEGKDVERLPEFRESEYLPLQQEELGVAAGQFAHAAPLYWYPPAGMPLHAVPVPYIKRTMENIPEGTIPLKEGARVVSRDGEALGEIEEVVTDETTRRATHLVITKGLIAKERVWLPTTWIDRVEEDEVRLAVGSRIVEQIKSTEHPPVARRS